MNPEKFSNCKLLVVGDLMIDEYVWGDVNRISPEAPVPVVSVTREDYTLGGSGNVVNNLAALGAHILVAGVTGTDSGGTLMVQRFASMGVDAGGVVQDPRRPTTRKTRILGGSQQVLRIDRETRQDIAGETRKSIATYIQGAIPTVDAVLISDYGKGLLTPDLLATIIQQARQHDKPAIVDPKGLEFEKYRNAFLITPNKKEAGLAAGIEIVDPDTLDRAADTLFKKTGAQNLLITCGQEGMVLYEGSAGPYTIRSRARQVFDVSGAGDTVVAVTGLALSAGQTLREAAALANLAAGIVVGKIGTATVTLEELTAAVQAAADKA
jgi:rfaE bifunctional protein kinase chain/domain